MYGIVVRYTFQIFREGRKRDLDEADLTKPLDEHKSNVLGDKMARLWSKEVAAAADKGRLPSMTKVIWRCFKYDIIRYALVILAMELGIRYFLIYFDRTYLQYKNFRLFQPMFLGLLIRYFDPRNKEDTEP